MAQEPNVNKKRNVPTTQVIQVPSTCKAYFNKFCNQWKSSSYYRQHALPSHSKDAQDMFSCVSKQNQSINLIQDYLYSVVFTIKSLQSSFTGN